MAKKRTASKKGRIPKAERDLKKLEGAYHITDNYYLVSDGALNLVVHTAREDKQGNTRLKDPRYYQITNGIRPVIIQIMKYVGGKVTYQDFGDLNTIMEKMELMEENIIKFLEENNG